MTPGTLGPYEIRGELGRGAMAIVWRAWDPKLEREVAVKEPVFPHGADPALVTELTARFVREGKAVAALSHPGIVTVYDADVFDGRPAIVMEIIRGRSLLEVLRDGPLSPRSAMSAADQLLEALAFAHASGIVHRDVKPDNVFVGDDGRVKLADFGVAHVGAQTALTQAGTIMGTPGYMAPEQISGDAVDGRADLFAAGVILYEMLTGTNPFIRGDAHPVTVMHRVMNEPIPDVRMAASGIPDSLAATIERATCKDAGQRFSDADQMRRALAGGSGPPLADAVAPAPGKSKAGIAWAIAAAASVALGAGVFLWTGPSLTARQGAPAKASEVASGSSVAGDKGSQAAESSFAGGLSMPGEVEAPSSGKQLSMPSVNVEAWIVADGSMRVVEERTFAFTGDFSRVYWDMPVQGSELGATRIDVLGMGVDGKAARRLAAPDAERPEGAYAVANDGSILHAEVYHRSTDTRRTFRIEYLVRTGAVARWGDTAELYWKCVGDGWGATSDKVRVLVHLPEGVTRDQVRAWGHGPLNGIVRLNDDGSVSLAVDDLPAGQFVEARVLFPRAALADAASRPGARLQSVVDQETRWAEEASAGRRGTP